MDEASAQPGPRIKTRPEDFVVEEVASYPPSGEGGHTFVWIEKRGRGTEEVARELARAGGVAASEIGYAGRKDRQALTRQWFSVPGLAPEEAMALTLRDATVLRAERHEHKLRTGHLKGNRFELLVRDVVPELIEGARARAAEISERGLANPFGEQRFGRERNNAERGLAILRGKKRVHDRREARFLISALQSEVFNAVAEERPLAFDRFELGDVARVEASGGLFLVDDVAEADARAARFEISPTGPIFGLKELRPEGAPAAREAALMERLGIPPLESLRPPRGIRLRGARRPFRVPVAGLRLEPDPEGLRLYFELPSGSYATVLVDRLFADE